MSNTEVATQNSRAQVPAIAPPRLPYHPALQERFGVGQAEWRALVDAVFPLAKETSSIILALSYCKARKLDPFKKPVHIVPMWNGALKRMVETVWPGIGELRTTAFRTGQYAGRDEAQYGETLKRRIGNVDMEFPEWCQVTVYRLLGGQRLPFPGPRVYWLESYATAGRDDASPNSMWKRRPFGQLDKCAEAASLRAAFPEEVGNEYAAEEMEGRTIEGTASERQDAPMIAPSRSLAERIDALAGEGTVEHDPETGEVVENGDQLSDPENSTRTDMSRQAVMDGTETLNEARGNAGLEPLEGNSPGAKSDSNNGKAETAPAKADKAPPKGQKKPPTEDLFSGKSSAWRFGYSAGQQGVPRDRPSRDLGPDEVEEWEQGWDAADAEAVKAGGK